MSYMGSKGERFWEELGVGKEYDQHIACKHFSPSAGKRDIANPN